MKSLGPSNDAPPEVYIEMRAAERFAEQSTYLPDICDDVWDLGAGTLSFGDSEYLPCAWAWRIDRPLAEQLAETARDDAKADALVGNAASNGMTCCTCGHAVEEHGNDPEYPGSSGCGECPPGDCIAYESGGAL